MDEEEYQQWVESEKKRTVRQDSQWTAFDWHKQTCERCRNSYEFWCDVGMRLKP